MITLDTFGEIDKALNTDYAVKSIAHAMDAVKRIESLLLDMQRSIEYAKENGKGVDVGVALRNLCTTAAEQLATAPQRVDTFDMYSALDEAGLVDTLGK